MQLVQLDDILVSSLEADADAMLAHWQLRLSQLVKVDSCLVSIVSVGEHQGDTSTWLPPRLSTLASWPAHSREMAFEHTLCLPLPEQSTVETLTEKSDPPLWLGWVASV